MDRITEELVDFTVGLSDSFLTPTVKEAAIRHLVDSVACAIAGSDIDAVQIAKRIARMSPNEQGATLFGESVRVAPDMAAFANTTMVRAWDWNDGLFGNGGHTSDMIPPLLAIGEMAHSTPADFLLAMVLAYEVLGAFRDARTMGGLPFDQGTYMGPAAALGMGKLLGLTKDQLASAVGMSVAQNIPLSAGRHARTMWKCSATAASLRSALFGVLLAKEGMNGPTDAFQGNGGLWDKVTGPFEVNLPAKPDGPRIVEASYMKRYPVDMHAQAVVGTAPKIRSLRSLEEIETIEVETYWSYFWNLTRDPSTYDPRSREVADHSFPYAFAVALVDGRLTRDSYLPDRILDPALRPVMAKIKVRENREFTKNFYSKGTEVIGAPRFRVTIHAKDGTQQVEEITYHRGHMLNPMTREDIDEKLDDACVGVVDNDQKEEIRNAWWGIDGATTISEPINTLASFN